MFLIMESIPMMHLSGSDITEAIKALEAISAKFGVDFVLSVSADATELSDEVKSHIIVSL